jgi:hypothetical protein
MPRPKPEIRWDWIEEQYVRGHLTNGAIARLHEETFGISVRESGIRSRAVKWGWQREVAEAVRRRTRQKLIQGATIEQVQQAAATEQPENKRRVEYELNEIDSAADRAAEIIRLHRYHAERLHAVATCLERYVVAMLPIDEAGNPTLAYEPGEIKDLASAVSHVASARDKAIQIERRAWSLDEESEGKLGSDSALLLLRKHLYDSPNA